MEVNRRKQNWAGRKEEGLRRRQRREEKRSRDLERGRWGEISRTLQGRSRSNAAGKRRGGLGCGKKGKRWRMKRRRRREGRLGGEGVERVTKM